MPKTKTQPRAPRPSRPSVRGVPYEVVTSRQRRLHVPHRSRHVPVSEWGDFPRRVPLPGTTSRERRASGSIAVCVIASMLHWNAPPAEA